MNPEDMIAGIIDESENLDDAEETTEELVDRLAALPALEYDRVRKAEANRAGVRIKNLDAAVERARRNIPAGDLEQEDIVDFLRDVDPWPEAVDGAELLDNVVAELRKYMVLPIWGAEAVALWILHAHLHDTAANSPILAITSPSPECGKTTLLEFLGELVPRALSASNITAPAFFRSVEKWYPTVLIDEADTFLRDSDDLRGVLNSGHRRSTAFVLRTAGESHEPRQFRTWAPKAIALIGKLPATLQSRSIEIALQRKTAKERVEELRTDRTAHLGTLCRQCARFAIDVADAVSAADPELPHGVYGRTADNWRHLIAIADVAGGAWPGTARLAAEAAAVARTEETAGIMMLEDIRAIFAERQTERLLSTDIVQALGRMEDRPWSEWRSGNPITARQLSKLLDPFGVSPTKFRSEGHTPGTRGYELGAFADAFARYLSPTTPSPSATAPQPKESASFEGSHPPQNGAGVADRIGRKPAENLTCGAVADTKGESAPNFSGWSDEDWQALYDERAGIMEFDGGLSRDEAEARAAEEIRHLRNGSGEPDLG